MGKILKNCGAFLKEGKRYFISAVAVIVLVIPAIIMLGYYLKASWYAEELMYMYLYQYLCAFLCGMGLILFMRRLVDEEGREIFYIRKKLYIGEAMLFYLLSELVVVLSGSFSGITSYFYKEGIVWLSAELFLVYGILYFSVFITGSSVTAAGILILLLLVSFGGNSAYTSVVVILSDHLKGMLIQTEYILGLGLLFWGLGGLANYGYERYE